MILQTDSIGLIDPSLVEGSNFWVYVAIFLAIYEVVIRYIPTVKDFTVIGLAYRILNILIKNRSKIGKRKGIFNIFHKDKDD